MIVQIQLAKINILKCCSCNASLFLEKIGCLGTKIMGIYEEGPWDIMFLVLVHPQRRKHANKIDLFHNLYI